MKPHGVTAYRPDLSAETELFAQGFRRVAGIDEAGRGALAGPVVAAAVILPREPRGDWLDGVRDSKVLNRSQRERLYLEITTHALAVGVGMAHHGVIETRNIVGATRLAMRRAVNHLAAAPDFLLIDYLRLPEVDLPQRGITHGDALCLSIACASIVAKVTRDVVMSRFDERYPGYGLAAHKGYGTRRHLECLRRLGPCRIHRRSFAPVRKLLLPTLL